MHANAPEIPAIAGLMIRKSLISNSLCMLNIPTVFTNLDGRSISTPNSARKADIAFVKSIFLGRAISETVAKQSFRARVNFVNFSDTSPSDC
jgi:hypothetical protein